MCDARQREEKRAAGFNLHLQRRAEVIQSQVARSENRHFGESQNFSGATEHSDVKCDVCKAMSVKLVKKPKKRQFAMNCTFDSG